MFSQDKHSFGYLNHLRLQRNDVYQCNDFDLVYCNKQYFTHTSNRLGRREVVAVVFFVFFVV
jgi:hypothetical protein